MRGLDLQTIVYGVAMLAAGLFVMSMLYNSMSPATLYKYNYATSAVSGVQVVNSTANATYTVTANLVTVNGLPYNVTLKAVIDNSGSVAHSVDIYLNGQKVATVNAISGNNTYTVILPNAQLPSSNNIVLASPTTAGNNITGQIVALTYPGSVATTEIGAAVSNVTHNTEEAYYIVIVAFIIAAVALILRLMHR